MLYTTTNEGVGERNVLINVNICEKLGNELPLSEGSKVR